MNRIKNIAPLLLFVMIFACRIQAQPVGKQMSENKKAMKFFDDAQMRYREKLLDETIELLQKATNEDPKFLEAYLFMAEVYFDLKKPDLSIQSFQNVIDIDPEYRPKVFYRVASIEQQTGKFKEAKAHYLQFLQYNNTGEKAEAELKNNARNNIRNCEVGDSLMAHPVPFFPKNLGPNINTANGELAPSLTADEQNLVITRVEKASGTPCPSARGRNEDFYLATRTDGDWTTVQNMGAPLNTNCNEGAQSISPDGRYMFFAACERPEGIGRCDIYWAKRQGNRWTEPVNMGKPVNSETWDTQPSFSSDGKTLYFVSIRAGGQGKSDIWKTELQADGSWSNPVNLGPTINTPGDENSPYIHPDDQTLYFASDKHPGIGGIDLFYARKDANGNFTKPRNLGSPINTLADERSLIVNADGNRAYFASNTLKGYGDYDVFSFDLYEGARPFQVTYMKGKVTNKKTKVPLEAYFELIDLESGKIIVQANSDKVNGEFLVCIPTNRNYALNVSKNGFLFHSENFSLKGNFSKTDPYRKDVELKPIEIFESVVLKNIFFDTNLFDLKKESATELEKLVGLLNLNKTMTIEISGHTDNRGGKDLNLKLSDNRAKAVYQYLIDHGIAATRLSYKGYGDSKPIADNNTEEGRAINRRTEFKVTGF